MSCCFYREAAQFFLNHIQMCIRDSYYPLDSIKEGADEPVATDTCCDGVYVLQNRRIFDTDDIARSLGLDAVSYTHLSLENQPHTLYIILGITPVAERIQVTEIELVLLALLDAGLSLIHICQSPSWMSLAR